MKKRILVLSCSLLISIMVLASHHLTVVQWNIWQEGTMVDGGYDAIVAEIVRLHPDFVTLSEVRNYHHTDFTKRLCRSLQQKGLKYYSFYSYDSGLLSRYPIEDSATIFPNYDDHGSIYKLVTHVHGQRFAVYTAHLDYLNDAYYNVRGVDGSTWKEIPALTDVNDILRINVASKRDDAVRLFIADAQKEILSGSQIILGGDFNEPSFKDWTRKTRHLYDHHGVVVPWTVSVLLDRAGFMDTYRYLHPDILKYPGFTYPSFNKAKPDDKVTWAPKSDERDRIDYVFCKGSRLRPVCSKIFGPRQSIVRSKTVTEKGKDRFITPLDVWPTDHKGVWVEFRY